jgi:hypothetical protein
MGVKASRLLIQGGEDLLKKGRCMYATGIILERKGIVGQTLVELVIDGKRETWNLANSADVPSNHTSGLFRFEPEDQFCFWVDERKLPPPMDNKLQEDECQRK